MTRTAPNLSLLLLLPVILEGFAFLAVDLGRLQRLVIAVLKSCSQLQFFVHCRCCTLIHHAAESSCVVDKSYRADNALKRIGNHDSLGGEQYPLATLGWGYCCARAHRPGTQAKIDAPRTSRMNSTFLGARDYLPRYFVVNKGLSYFGPPRRISDHNCIPTESCCKLGRLSEFGLAGGETLEHSG